MIRRREDEWMDDPAVDPAELADALRFIRWVNQVLGYNRATIGHLRRLAGEGRVTVLDVATGSGDLPRELAADPQFKFVGLDLHEATLRQAAGIVRVRGDATRLPFADGAFDFVICGMFLHHLDEPVVVDVLREMDRVARRGIVVADLLRSRRAMVWIRLFTLLSSPMVRHDARVSIAGAFTVDELSALLKAAGVDYVQPRLHFGHRVVFSGVKG